MDHKLLCSSKDFVGNKKKLSLPPISSMDAVCVSQSWTSIATNSPKPSFIESINDITMRVQENSIVSPTISTSNDRYHERSYRRNQANDYKDSLDAKPTHYLHHHNEAPQAPFRDPIARQSTSSFTSDRILSADIICSSNIQLHNKGGSMSTQLVSKDSCGLEEDIDKVIFHCNRLSSDIESHRHRMVQGDGNTTYLWLDDMIGKANEVLNALLRLRKFQLATEQRQHYQTDTEIQGRKPQDSFTKNSLVPTSGILSFSSDKNRRRGVYVPYHVHSHDKRPAFQGRCHSCNISETPEWRRGPDGARTLCNACGLHYAKLSKKKNKQDDMKTTS